MSNIEILELHAVSLDTKAKVGVILVNARDRTTATELAGRFRVTVLSPGRAQVEHIGGDRGALDTMERREKYGAWIEIKLNEKQARGR